MVQQRTVSVLRRLDRLRLQHDEFNVPQQLQRERLVQQWHLQLLLALDWAGSQSEPPITRTGPAPVQQVFSKLTGQTPPAPGP